MSARELLEVAIGEDEKGATHKIYPGSITIGKEDLFQVLKASKIPRWGDESCIEIDNETWCTILKFVGRGGYADLTLKDYLDKMY